jgi:aminopeptidase-like protein
MEHVIDAAQSAALRNSKTALAENPSAIGREFEQAGVFMHGLMSRLFPICRSITGNGVRETLRILQSHIPLCLHEVASGTKVFDWTVPKEWNIRDAFVLDPQGRKIIDFEKNNLHVLGYAAPIDRTVSMPELQEHLYSLEGQPEAIPWVTSVYEERWGFCLTHSQRMKLLPGNYRVVIDSELKNGSLTYGELILPGTSNKEIFISTYVCHPSMANNELSGPVVATALAMWLANKPRRFTYRIVFIPETIGSIAYLSRNLEAMKRNIVAGFNLTCVGDERAYSFLPSRNGSTLADKVALNILKCKHPNFKSYSFLDRGSDERQYCSPGIDLPVVSLMRTKYREFPEYHTSLDNLELVTPAGLQGSFDLHRDCIELLERNRVYRTCCLGEPQLGKRGLYPTIATLESHRQVIDMLNVLAYADGTNDVIDISNIIQTPVRSLYPILEKLIASELLQEQATV